MNIDGLENISSSEDEEDVVRSNCQLLRQLETFVMILTVPYAHRAYSLQYLIALTDGIGCPHETVPKYLPHSKYFGTNHPNDLDTFDLIRSMSLDTFGCPN